MFYPQISGYEIHPLILSQRQRSGLDKDDIGSDDSSAVGLVANEHTVATLPASLRHLYKVSLTASYLIPSSISFHYCTCSFLLF